MNDQPKNILSENENSDCPKAESEALEVKAIENDTVDDEVAENDTVDEVSENDAAGSEADKVEAVENDAIDSDFADNQEGGALDFAACDTSNQGGACPKALVSLFDYVEIFVASVIAVLILFTFCFRLCQVDGRSMNNTLSHKEMLVTTNLFYEPEQGDIVVFHLVNNYYKQPLVKRVIATEGQQVFINFTTGEVKVDGVTLEEDYIFLDGGKYNMKPEFDKSIIETLSDGTKVLKATVPEGHIFVMGDNRNHSTDSRSYMVGFVDKNCLLGKALFRIKPFTTFD